MRLDLVHTASCKMHTHCLVSHYIIIITVTFITTLHYTIIANTTSQFQFQHFKSLSSTLGWVNLEVNLRGCFDTKLVPLWVSLTVQFALQVLSTQDHYFLGLAIGLGFFDSYKPFPYCSSTTASVWKSGNHVKPLGLSWGNSWTPWCLSKFRFWSALTFFSWALKVSVSGTWGFLCSCVIVKSSEG